MDPDVPQSSRTADSGSKEQGIDEATSNDEESSTCSSELEPKFQEKFNNLSSILMETNENLLTFEFMMKQIRQLAKIKPLLSQTESPMVEGAQSSQLHHNHIEQNERLEKVLVDITNALKTMSSLKSQLPQSPASCRQCEKLEMRNEFLEQEIQNKSKLVEQMTESVHRSRTSLSEEREKNLKLDQKLENEQRAAQKVGQDITKYVGQMKALEQEVASLKRERNKLKFQSSNSRKTDEKSFQDKLEREIESKRDLQAKFVDVEGQLGREIQKRESLEAKLADIEASRTNPNEYKDIIGIENEKRKALEAKLANLENVVKVSNEIDSESRRHMDILKSENNILRKKISEQEKKLKSLAECQLVESNFVEEDKKKTNLVMEGDVLTATTITESQDTLELKQKITRYEEIINDYENQMRDLKLGLESLQKELEEKCQMITNFHEVTPSNVQCQELKAQLNLKDQEYQKLKTKTKTLLKQHKSKTETILGYERKLVKVKQILLDLSVECNESDKNYKLILSHIGTEVEITVRLMAAYLNLPVQHEPIQCYGRRLSEWFCDIQALSSWLQRQLLAFGKRYWTGDSKTQKSIMSRILPLPKIPVDSEAEDPNNTLSQLSLATSRLYEPCTSQSIEDVVKNQDNITGKRSKSMKELLDDIK